MDKPKKGISGFIQGAIKGAMTGVLVGMAVGALVGLGLPLVAAGMAEMGWMGAASHAAIQGFPFMATLTFVTAVTTVSTAITNGLAKYNEPETLPSHHHENARGPKPHTPDIRHANLDVPPQQVLEDTKAGHAPSTLVSQIEKAELLQAVENGKLR